MRFGDCLSKIRAKTPQDFDSSTQLKPYGLAINEVCRVTNTAFSDWRLYLDGHQISTREAGKSSCAFLITNFSSLDRAVATMTVLQRDLPTVNLELIVAPDGRQDRGDGIGSYDRGDIDRLRGDYIADTGFSIALLVDAQNVSRHLTQRPAAETRRDVAPPRRGLLSKLWN